MSQIFHPLKRKLIYALIFIAILPVVLLLFYNFSFVHPPSTLMIKDSLLVRGYQHQWRSINEISPYLKSAVLLSEDGQFCFHHGVDWHQVAVTVNQKGGPKRGASTITMQLVKNLFLWHRLAYLRKALEIPYAMVADAVLSKRRIMELYLNIAEWGPGIYGAEAAAQYYFKRSAKKLTRRQAIYLAVSLPNPKLRNPAHPNTLLNELMIDVEQRMAHGAPYTRCLQN